MRNIDVMLRLSCLAMGLMTITASLAATVDPVTAQDAATRFARSLRAGKMMAPSNTALALSHAEPSIANMLANDYYVFNATDNSAFVIVAGDDRAEEILAYGEGIIDMSNLPCNLRWMLNTYKEQIEWLHAHPQVAVERAPVASDEIIAPMLTCIWSQSEPYYNMCPIYQEEYCVTGCIATAMAQVMYYWKYPAATPSLGSYTTRTHRIQVEAIPSQPLHWENMIDSYSGAYTQEQGDAVAVLMRYCGQSSNMDYSPDGSGSYVRQQLQGVRAFGYRSASMIDRSDYDIEDWERLMLEDLRAGRPILYSGNDPLGGGHAFVLDGYLDGKYHINWGWAATGNGYFALGAFNVRSYAFNSSQQMLHNVYPSNQQEPQAGFDLESDGLFYRLNDEGNAVQVSFKDSQFDSYQGHVTIPDHIDYNGKTLPVTGIGESAFRNCDGLASVTIPSSVKYIGDYAFRNCINLASITIPEGVTSIGAQAFANCLKLASVNLPEGIKSVGTMAFQDCFDLKRVETPSVEAWLGITFDSHYSNPLSYAHDLLVDGNRLTDLVIPGHITRVQPYSFIECTGITSVTIQDGTTDIGIAAFAYCSGIEEISLPMTLTTIDDQAFFGCSALTGITIPASVTQMNYAAFASCSGLKSINIPQGVTTIDTYLFDECTALTSITIPDHITSIGYGAFMGCTALSSITIPGSVTLIGDNAFSGCAGLKSLKLSNALTEIGMSAFANCAALPTVVIPNSVKIIHKSAFEKCTILNDLTIGDHVELIEDKAFYNCNRLANVSCLATTPPVIENPNAFTRSIYKSATLHVPQESYDTYRNEGLWSWFTKVAAIALREDVNRDNEVNIADVNAVIDILFTSEYSKNADVNGDGEINISDANAVINKIFKSN